MGGTGPQGLQVASLGRRVCAGLDEVRPFTIPGRWKVVIWVVSGVVRVRIRNWRTRGYRALGLRRVDVRTAGRCRLAPCSH